MTKRKYPEAKPLQLEPPAKPSLVQCPNCGKQFKPRGLGSHFKECSNPGECFNAEVIKAKLGL